MKYKLKEKEGEEPTTGAEEVPTGGGGSKEKVEYNLVLTPDGAPIEGVIKSFEKKENYGVYLSNLTNTQTNLKKALEDEFGPSIPSRKKAAEKLRGKPFPPKTKPAIDAFINNFSESKPNILYYEVEGDSLVFPASKNPTKEVTKKIINTVMKNAHIYDYELKEKESVSEAFKAKFQKLIKESLLKVKK